MYKGWGADRLVFICTALFAHITSIDYFRKAGSQCLRSDSEGLQ